MFFVVQSDLEIQVYYDTFPEILADPGVTLLEEPVLKIPRKKYTDETIVISMRLPKDMLRELDAAAKASRRTRNDLLTLCLEFALEHMQIVTNGEKEKEPQEGRSYADS